MTPQAVRSECVQLAAERAAALVHRRMKQGFSSLASIVYVAPFVGSVGTALGILGSFRGITGEKYSSEAAMVDLLLLVTIQAVWTLNYLSDRIEALHTEMETAARGFTVLSSPHGNGKTVFHTLVFRG